MWTFNPYTIIYLPTMRDGDALTAVVMCWCLVRAVVATLHQALASLVLNNVTSAN